MGMGSKYAMGLPCPLTNAEFGTWGAALQTSQLALCDAELPGKCKRGREAGSDGQAWQGWEV